MEAHFNFLVLLNKHNDLYSLSHKEQILLDKIAEEIGSTKNLYVKNLLSCKKIGSQVTLHKTLHLLVNKGFLKLNPSSENRRLKQIKITNIFHKRYKKLNAVIRQACKST